MDFDAKNYIIKSGIHRDKKVIWVSFEYDRQLINALKKEFPSVKWSASNKKWYLNDVKAIRERFNLPVNQTLSESSKNKLSPENRRAYERFIEELQLRAYSQNTIKTYGAEFVQLLQLLGNKNINELNQEALRSYFLYCLKKLKLSENSIHSRVNAVKFYFEKVLKKEKFFIDIPRPKKKSSLPKVLSKYEVQQMFAITKNTKHLLVLKLSYGLGLRVSEIVNLKINHIDSKRMLVLIESGKGKKDRYVPLPESVLLDLRNYYKEYKPKEYLFEGQYGGQYSARSAQAVFKSAMRKANINKKIGIHGLRHSYATHLLEYGTDMYLIQKLLGHNQIKTTEIYAKVGDKQLSKIKSPLDFI